MKKLNLVLTLIVVLAISSCSNSTKKAKVVEFKEKVIVAYFHGERRCETCIAVGDLAKLTVEENFKDNKDVAFKEINIELDENKAIAEKYEIAGSAMLIIVDGKAEDITGFAFQNALNKPELLKDRIIELVEKGL
jgi:hypothetical protein